MTDLFGDMLESRIVRLGDRGEETGGLRVEPVTEAGEVHAVIRTLG